MSRLHEIYQYLRRIDDPAVDLAMAAALPTADPLAAKLLVLSLLERMDPQGTVALIEQFHQLEPELQDTIAQHAYDLYRALRQVAGQHQGQAPVNVIRIVAKSREPRLAYLMIEPLRHGSLALRQQAGQCLLELTQEAVGEAGSAAGDPHALTLLQGIIEEAVSLYRAHQQSSVLTALSVLILRPMPSSMQCLGEAHHAATAAMRTLLQHPDHPAIRRAALSLVRLPTLTAAALRGLRESCSKETLSDVLAGSHLAICPRVASLVGRLTENEVALPDPRQHEQRSPETLVGLVRWIGIIRMDPWRRVEHLARFVQVRDRAARLAALRQLLALAQQEGPQLLGISDVISSFCTDTDPSIARIALRHLIYHRWEGLARLLLRLVNSPHPSIRQLASHHLAPLGFGRLWDAWPRLSFAQRLAAGRALIKIDRSFHHQLGQRLAANDRDSRLRALSIIHGLNQGELFEAALITLAADANEKVASAAVRALGSAQGAGAIDALEQALRHPDSRVRANAVEALQQLHSTRHVQRLVEMAQSDDNRPRANAIQALLEMRTSDALVALQAMLIDARPKHRISALWLVETMGLMEVARQVAEMSLTDPEQEVQGRADKVIHQLIEAVRPTPAAVA